MKLLIFTFSLILIMSCSNKPLDITQKEISEYSQLCQPNMGLSKVYLTYSGTMVKCENNSFIKKSKNLDTQMGIDQLHFDENFYIQNSDVIKCQDLCKPNGTIDKITLENKCIKWTPSYRISTCEKFQQITRCTCQNKITQEYLR